MLLLKMKEEILKAKGENSVIRIVALKPEKPRDWNLED